MSDYLIALFLGFSFGNLWLCALLVFSLQTTNRFTCMGYLIGRALAILLLTVVISITGRYIEISAFGLNLASGILLVLFGIYLLLTRILGWIPPWKSKKTETVPSTGKCDGNCDGCSIHSDPELNEHCKDCHDHGLCAAEEPEVEYLTREARKDKKQNVEKTGKTGFAFGMSLGAIRGVTLCSKMIVLVPFILDSDMGKALLLGLIFSVSSSVYPLLGFIFGKFAMKLVNFKKALFIISCIILFATGIYYILAPFFNH